MLLTPERIQAIAWSLTLVLETAGAAALWPAVYTRPLRLRRVVWTVLAVNAVTHPLFWLALRRLAHPGPHAVLIAETIVAAVEAALYAWLLWLSPGRALGLSLTLNLLSWVGGVLFWQRLFATRIVP
ncbi:MAG: hypothetical protein IT329_12190 [Caldilineaceae bacterium]|nr:hypothetical protein [Caldilineaceae bacterium]